MEMFKNIVLYLKKMLDDVTRKISNVLDVSRILAYLMYEKRNIGSHLNTEDKDEDVSTSIDDNGTVRMKIVQSKEEMKKNNNINNIYIALEEEEQAAKYYSISSYKESLKAEVAAKVKAIEEQIKASKSVEHEVSKKKTVDIYSKPIVKNSYGIDDYEKEIQQLIERGSIHGQQITIIMEKLKTQEFYNLIGAGHDKYRYEFRSLKSKLIEKWENKMNQKWPVYAKDYYDNNGLIVRKKGESYDARQIIQLSQQGKNEWWNIYPVYLN